MVLNRKLILIKHENYLFINISIWSISSKTWSVIHVKKTGYVEVNIFDFVVSTETFFMESKERKPNVNVLPSVDRIKCILV